MKLIVYRLDGKNVSKNTPGAVKVESPNWFILYRGRDGGQRREATGTDSKMKAEALLIKRLGEVGMGKTPAQDIKSIRYEEIRDSYMRENPEQAKYRGWGSIDEFFAKKKISHINTNVIRSFIEHRRSSGVTDPTIRRNLNVLRAMFNLARKEGKLGLSDVPYFPMPKDSDAAGQYIEPSQFVSIRKHLPKDIQPFFDFMYATGCRLGALQKITWDMVNADCTHINLAAEIVKSRRSLLIVLAGSQLTPIAEMLRRMFRDPRKPVFNFTNYRREWAKAVAKAGLGTWNAKTQTRTGVRIHDCRCSAAITCLRLASMKGSFSKSADGKLAQC